MSLGSEGLSECGLSLVLLRSENNQLFSSSVCHNRLIAKVNLGLPLKSMLPHHSLDTVLVLEEHVGIFSNFAGFSARPGELPDYFFCKYFNF